jgi:nicotinamide-nucleotide amidase
MVPERATILTNRRGTAPGLLLEDEDGRWVAMLPGVPNEMRGIMTEELLPRLRARRSDDRHVIRSLTLRTTGIPESRLPDLLGEHAEGFGKATLAYLPGQEGVDLRLTVRNATASDADRILDESAAILRAKLGRHWYADGPTDLAEVVIHGCRRAGLHIVVAESCTGGLLAARLTSVSGSSAVFLGGVIAYDNAVKVNQLGVDAGLLERAGAVSEDVARAMASGARSLLGAEIGVGITGIAGPDGGTPEKPVGLVWIAVDVGERMLVHGGRFIGYRAEVRFRASQAALDVIRREVAGIP